MTLHERLEDLMRTILADESISLADDTSFAELPGWDSVAYINFMFSLEGELDVQFGPEGLAEFETVGALKAHLAGLGVA